MKTKNARVVKAKLGQVFSQIAVKSIQFRHRVITWDISKHNGPTPRRFHLTFQNKFVYEKKHYHE